jgi:hypothetical protein
MTSLDKNFTTSSYVWYDTDSDRARLTTSWKGKKVSIIVWEDKGKKFTIVDHKCKARDINPKYNWIGDGHGHLIDTSKLFHFGEELEQGYQGRRNIRGIQCDHWSLETSHKWLDYDYNFTIHWYFSADGWKMKDTGANRVPVRAEVYGFAQKKSNEKSEEDDDLQLEAAEHNAGSHKFHHIYDFLHFSPQEPKKWVFDPTKHSRGCEDYHTDIIDLNPSTDNDDNNHFWHDGGARGWTLVGVAAVVGVFAMALGMVVSYLLLRKRADRRAQQGYVGLAGLHT